LHFARIQVKTSIHKHLLKNRSNSFLLSENTLVIIVQDCMIFVVVKLKETIYEIKKALAE